MSGRERCAPCRRLAHHPDARHTPHIPDPSCPLSPMARRRPRRDGLIGLASAVAASLTLPERCSLRRLIERMRSGSPCRGETGSVRDDLEPLASPDAGPLGSAHNTCALLWAQSCWRRRTVHGLSHRTRLRVGRRPPSENQTADISPTIHAKTVPIAHQLPGKRANPWLIRHWRSTKNPTFRYCGSVNAPGGRECPIC